MTPLPDIQRTVPLISMPLACPSTPSAARPPCLCNKQVSKVQLLECCESEFFEGCGLVVSRDQWRKKEIRSHTKHVYQQRK